MSEQSDMELIRRHVDQLAEHFDSVQIFVTRTESNGTVNMSMGAGNWFARYGQISNWVTEQDAITRKKVQQALDDE